MVGRDPRRISKNERAEKITAANLEAVAIASQFL